MLLTLRTTHAPATDLGYLLHKNPARAQSFDLSFGQAHVFYPEVTRRRCTAALLLDVDPVALVRGPARRGADAGAVRQRPPVCRLLVPERRARPGLRQRPGRALQGAARNWPRRRCRWKRAGSRPQPGRGRVSCAACSSRWATPSRRKPTRWTPTFPDWGDSPYFSVTLTGTVRLADLLTHLYVLIPTLDSGKHYAIGDDEVEKLIRKGEGWLAAHPEKETIVRRYLKAPALAGAGRPGAAHAGRGAGGRRGRGAARPRGRGRRAQDQPARAAPGRGPGGAERRAARSACWTWAAAKGACWSLLLQERQFTDILGMDVSYRSLEMAQDKLRLDRLPPMQRERDHAHARLADLPRRAAGRLRAAAVVEVIEHLDPPRLAAFERVLFEFARPKTVVVTTPNVEYNPKFETLPAGQFRHKDHRFEWTRAEFQSWADGICERFGYTARFLPIGPEDAEVGAPSQMAVFETG